MRVVFTILWLCVLQDAEPRHQLDLEGMLGDEAALQELKIAYLPPMRESYQRFFVYGDGSVIWQAYPRRSMSLALIPTCRNKVGTDTVKNLVHMIIEKHFLDLPERQFLVAGVEPEREELEFHTISIDDGVGAARKTFAVGEYAVEESHSRLTWYRLKKNFRESKSPLFRMTKLLVTLRRLSRRGTDLLI